MINLILKIAVILIGALIGALLLIQQSGVGIGIRTNGNIFTDQVAQMSVISWILILLLGIELVLVILIFIPLKRT